MIKAKETDEGFADESLTLYVNLPGKNRGMPRSIPFREWLIKSGEVIRETDKKSFKVAAVTCSHSQR